MTSLEMKWNTLILFKNQEKQTGIFILKQVKVIFFVKSIIIAAFQMNIEWNKLIAMHDLKCK